MAERMMITDEILAAFLDGNVSGKEAEAILKAAVADSTLREFLSIAADVSDHPLQESSPLAALAAEAPDGLCAVHCERYVLQCFGITKSVEELVSYARGSGMMMDGGTPLANVGNISEHYGLSVRRVFATDLQEVEVALSDGSQVIAAVDVGELDPLRAEYEYLEDRIIGPRPDHCVVVLACDLSADEIVCYDPSTGDIPVSLQVPVFLDAWDDSENYMVVVSGSRNF